MKDDWTFNWKTETRWRSIKEAGVDGHVSLKDKRSRGRQRRSWVKHGDGRSWVKHGDGGDGG